MADRDGGSTTVAPLGGGTGVNVGGSAIKTMNGNGNPQATKGKGKAIVPDNYVPLGSFTLRLPTRGPQQWTAAGDEFKDTLRRTVEILELEAAEAERAERAEMEGQGSEGNKVKGKGKRGGRQVTELDVVKGLLWLLGDKDTMPLVEWKDEELESTTGLMEVPEEVRERDQDPHIGMKQQRELSTPAKFDKHLKEDLDSASSRDIERTTSDPGIPTLVDSNLHVDTLAAAGVETTAEDSGPVAAGNEQGDVPAIILAVDNTYDVAADQSAAQVDEHWEAMSCSDSELSTPPDSPILSVTSGLTPLSTHLSSLPPSDIAASGTLPPSDDVPSNNGLPMQEASSVPQDGVHQAVADITEGNHSNEVPVKPAPPRRYTSRVRIALLPADHGWRISQRRAAALRAVFGVLDKGWDGAEGTLLEVSVSHPILTPLSSLPFTCPSRSADSQHHPVMPREGSGHRSRRPHGQLNDMSKADPRPPT